MHPPSAPEQPVLRASQVGFAYGEGPSRRDVLCGVDMKVSGGEVVLLTGPSGSGKTTFVALAGTLRLPQTGSLQLWNEEIGGLGPKQVDRLRRRIGFIFQEHNLFEALTARQNVEMALAFDSLPEGSAQAADAALAAVGLAGCERAKPRELSTGQRQRVAIARALARQPQLVLADEPTAALDREAAAEFFALLRRHAQERAAAVLIVTHDARALPWADRVVRLLDGRTVADLAVRPLLDTARILHALPPFAGLPVDTLLALVRRLRARRFAAGDLVPAEEVFVLGPDGATWGAEALMRGAARERLQVGTGGLEARCLRAADLAAALAEPRDFELQLGAQLFHQAT